MDHGILYQNDSSTILLLDIPGSVEAAQSLSTDPKSSSRRLISCESLSRSYPSLEPKSLKAKAALNPRSLQELLLVKHLEFALQEVKDGWRGEWCLPRIVEDRSVSLETVDENVSRKRMKLDQGSREVVENRNVDSSPSQASKDILDDTEEPGLLYSNSTSKTHTIQISSSEHKFHIPPYSTFLSGLIAPSLPRLFTSKSTPAPPLFNFILLDPPWPNRSARRSKTYNTPSTTLQIRDLISSIPIHSLLTDDGFVAVWITNRDSFREMVCGPGGLFEEWDVQLVEEWVWVKTTSNGEPICALDGTWRKPWEVCLIGRRRKVDDTLGKEGDGDVKRRVIIGVPDLHSRKPNLRYLFEKIMGKGIFTEKDEKDEKAGAGYEALEIFARNLTAGCWSWGNEVLKFQSEECWVDEQKDG